jgi:hypothetical protein
MTIMQQEVTCCPAPSPRCVVKRVVPSYRRLVCRVILLSHLLRRIVVPLVEWWHGIRLGAVGGAPSM